MKDMQERRRTTARKPPPTLGDEEEAWYRHDPAAETVSIVREWLSSVPRPIDPGIRWATTVQFRKQHLARYLTALVTRPYDAKMVQYLDVVGKIHTPKAGSEELDVPLVQMNALTGFVADALTAAILSLELDRETEVRTLRAFNKLLWLQNDLINRHYHQAQASAERLSVSAVA